MTPLVIDASALVDYVTWTSKGAAVASRIDDPDVRMQVPQVCSIEVVHALRGLTLGRKIDTADGAEALALFQQMPISRHSAEPYLDRIWSLRDNLTAYDATYVALAEALEVPLMTTDAKFDTPTVRQLIAVEVLG